MFEGLRGLHQTTFWIHLFISHVSVITAERTCWASSPLPAIFDEGLQLDINDLLLKMTETNPCRTDRRSSWRTRVNMHSKTIVLWGVLCRLTSEGCILGCWVIRPSFHCLTALVLIMLPVIFRTTSEIIYQYSIIEASGLPS